MKLANCLRSFTAIMSAIVLGAVLFAGPVQAQETFDRRVLQEPPPGDLHPPQCIPHREAGDSRANRQSVPEFVYDLADVREKALQQKMIVADLHVSGNKRITAKEFFALLRSRKGAEYEPELIQEDIRTLMATNRFGNVRARYKSRKDGQVEVTFEVVEFPNVIEEIVFEGTKLIARSDLEKEIGLTRNQPLNPVANQVACRKIESIYHATRPPPTTPKEWSFLSDRQLLDIKFAQVSACCILKEGGRAKDKRVVFAITEKIDSSALHVDFAGNTFFSNAELCKRFVELISDRNLRNSTKKDLDVEQFRKDYRAVGYHDVKVSREVKWDMKSREGVLLYRIDEGPRSPIKAIPARITSP
jgi:outer membrane protein assembly factor BamA